MVKEIYEFDSVSGDDDTFEAMGIAKEVDKATRDAIRDKFHQRNEERLQVPASLAADWKPLKVFVDHWCEDCKPSDYPGCWMIPIFSRRAVDVLGDLLAEDGELLPLDCDEGEYFAYNVTRIIDVLDKERSQIDWHIDVDRSGPRIRAKKVTIRRIYHFEIHQERMGDAAIFRLPQCLFDLYVTDVFRDRAEEAGLQGMEFTKVWPPLRPEKPRLPDWFFKT
jgi:hypothetical protein